MANEAVIRAAPIENHNNRDRRAFRRKINQVLAVVQNEAVTDAEHLDVKVKAVRRRNWKKCPDESLGKVVRWKLKRRQRIGINQSLKEILKPVK